MKSSVEKLNDTRAKLTVEVPFEELTSEFDQAYRAIAQQVSIPGFRKGKAPRQLIDARFGRGPVIEQVLNDMLPSRYSAAVAEQELAVMGRPTIDVTKIEDGDVIEFTAEVDVRPEFELPSFEDISVEVPALENADDLVEKRLDDLRQRFSSLNSVDRPVQEKDFVTLNLVAEIDGEELEESKSEGMTYEVGSGDLIEGLDEALVGLSVDESKQFQTTMIHPDHAGKEATVTVTVTAVKERVLPEANDEFAQMASEFDTLDELRESFVSGAVEDTKASQAAAVRDEVLKAALAKCEFPLPEGVVQEQVDAQVNQLVSQLGGDEKILDMMLKAENKTREQFDIDTRTRSEEAVRNQIFLDALAQKYGVEVTQEEISDHLVFTAQRYGMNPLHFLQQLEQSGQTAVLYEDVRRGKALAQAICHVTVTDSEGNSVDPKAYFGEDPEEAPEVSESSEESAE